MIVGIHQPNYLPWIGFFLKMARSDRFVLLDDVQYVRRGYSNRNRIKTPDGVRWLTVPVQTKGLYTALIGEIVPCWDVPWVRRHLRTLEVSYARAPHYEAVVETVVRPALDEAERDATDLASLNAALIARIAAFLGVATPVVRASTFAVSSSATQRLIDLVHAVGGTTYLSGLGGVQYQDVEQFAASGVEIVFNEFHHPVYEQLWGRFEPNLSVLDLLFMRGREAAEYVQAAAVLPDRPRAAALAPSAGPLPLTPQEV